MLHLRCSQATFFHESVLFFHDLSDQELSLYSTIVKTGYSPASLKAGGIKVYTIKNVGLIMMNTIFAKQRFRASNGIHLKLATTIL